MDLANSPAISLVLCPLNSASSLLRASNVDSCTSTSAPRARAATPTELHVSPRRHRRRPGRSGPRTCSGRITRPSGVSTHSPFFSFLYSLPGGNPSAVAFSTSMRPAWSGSSTTYPKHGTGCRRGAARTTRPPSLGFPRGLFAWPPRPNSLCTVQYGNNRDASRHASRSRKCGASGAPLSGHRSPRNILHRPSDARWVWDLSIRGSTGSGDPGPLAPSPGAVSSVTTRGRPRAVREHSTAARTKSRMPGGPVM